jgi:hypothetical protein
MFEDEAESSRRWQRLTIDGKVRTIDIVFTEGVGSSAAQRRPRRAVRIGCVDLSLFSAAVASQSSTAEAASRTLTT